MWQRLVARQANARVTQKRKNVEDGFDAGTPLKTRSSASKRARIDPEYDSNTPATTELTEGQPLGVSSTPRRRGRPPKNAGHEPVYTPKKNLPNNPHVDFATPTKEAIDQDVRTQAPLIRNSDHFARRKSARRVIGQATGEDESDDASLEGEESLARRIWEEDQTEDSADEQDSAAEPGEDELGDPGTPSKPRHGRGRPKARRKQPTPSPPRDLPPYEQYFFQNRPGGAKTSSNTLSSLSLLSHESYFEKMSACVEPHEEEITFLQQLHIHAFGKWIFELEQDFNLCLYGWGSKRALLDAFAVHLNDAQPAPRIIVVNGYNPGLTSRDILTTLASAIPSLASSGQKLGSQPADMQNTILSALTAKPPAVPVVLLINSIDSHSLRRPATQAILARLASSPHIQVIATADTPNFPLMWDTTLCAQYKWLYHDVTTFRPFQVELSSRGEGGGVVDEVNALLGRSGRKMQGREGVMYVLKSLTENARSLFSMLIAELLTVDDEDGTGGNGIEEDGNEDDDGVALATPKKGRTNGNVATTRAGIDFRTLYQKAASQFIATNETTFRGLLREFYDHEMIISRKDGLGGEIFGVPFRREEMEAILEELAMEADG